MPESPEAAVPQECTGKWDQAQVVQAVFVIPHQNGPALVQPGQRPLDRPAARLASPRLPFSALLANRANVADVVELLERLVSRGVVVAFVQAQMLLGVGSLGHDGVQQILHTNRIMPVGPGRHHRQRADLGTKTPPFTKSSVHAHQSCLSCPPPIPSPHVFLTP